MCIYIYIYIEREGEREYRERDIHDNYNYIYIYIYNRSYVHVPRFLGSKKPIALCTSSTEAYGFVEFEISSSTISTVFRQPLSTGHLRRVALPLQVNICLGGTTCLTLLV